MQPGQSATAKKIEIVLVEPQPMSKQQPLSSPSISPESIATFLESERNAEDLDDDANFADQSNNRLSLSTTLSPPPPSHMRSPSPRRVPSQSSLSGDISKPLPRVPNESQEVLTPQPRRVWANITLIEDKLPCSRFSVSTISTEGPDRDSEEELNEDLDMSNDIDSDGDDDDDEFEFQVCSQDANGGLFTGYSLPEAETNPHIVIVDDKERGSSPLHDLLTEMGYF